MSSRAEGCLPRRDEGACPWRPVTEEQQRQTPVSATRHIINRTLVFHTQLSDHHQ